MTSVLSTSTPPGGTRRAVSRFKPRVMRAVIAELVSVALTAATWFALVRFDQSLKIGEPGPVIARVIEIILAIAALVVPAFGARAIARSLRARALASQGRLLDARVAAEDATNDLLYVLGLGLMSAMLAFG